MSGNVVPWQKSFGNAFAISLGLLALPDLLIMLFSAKDKRVVSLLAYGPISIAVYALCIFSLGILAYGVFTSEQLAPFMTNPDGLVPFLATSLLPAGFDGIDITCSHLCCNVNNECYSPGYNNCSDIRYSEVSESECA
jgi:sodium/pantothenate symporter